MENADEVFVLIRPTSFGAQSKQQYIFYVEKYQEPFSG
jgi:hypothetical protein